MKTRLLALFAALPALAMAAPDVPGLSFSAMKVELPALSLTEYTKQLVGERIFANAPVMSGYTPIAHRTVAPKLGSRMPIIVPREGIDPSMVAIPDSKAVYKLTIKDPGVEPIK
ncbi:MAG: hypothetical protein ABIZ04_00240 [Opitutus sp.]